VQTNTACERREFASTQPHALHAWLLYVAGTSTSDPPDHASL
jgi:hypothetical protein